MLNKNRVLVAMSGGVDSSVAITKLNEMGYETIGITLKLWETIDPVTKLRKNSHCNSTEAINGAKIAPIIIIKRNIPPKADPLFNKNLFKIIEKFFITLYFFLV